MKRPTPDFAELLRVLAEHRVEFIIVGGVAAVLQGAPISTFDLDVVHSRAPDNVVRALTALESLDALYRDPAGRRIAPNGSLLASTGHHLLMTRDGPLDLLGTIGTGMGYEELLGHTVELDLGSGFNVKVLDLPTLIRTKEVADREKDRAVLAILRRTLEQRSGR